MLYSWIVRERKSWNAPVGGAQEAQLERIEDGCGWWRTLVIIQEKGGWQAQARWSIGAKDNQSICSSMPSSMPSSIGIQQYVCTQQTRHGMHQPQRPYAYYIYTVLVYSSWVPYLYSTYVLLYSSLHSLQTAYIYTSCIYCIYRYSSLVALYTPKTNMVVRQSHHLSLLATRM